MRKLISVLSLLVFTTACAVGPNYKRPKVDVPGAYRGAPEEMAQAGEQSSQTAANPTKTSTPAGPALGDQKWWDVFQDPQLQELIRTALKQNYDVRIAAARIMENTITPSMSQSSAVMRLRLPCAYSVPFL